MEDNQNYTKQSNFLKFCKKNFPVPNFIISNAKQLNLQSGIGPFFSFPILHMHMGSSGTSWSVLREITYDLNKRSMKDCYPYSRTTTRHTDKI